MFKRAFLVEKLIGGRDNGKVKVVFGIRRSGKTTLLKLYQNELMKAGVYREQLIHIDLDMQTPSRITSKNVLAYIQKKLVPNRTSYIFLDEIQKIKGYEDLVSRICEFSLVDVYVCGSSNDLVSGKLAEALEGKVTYIPVLGISYREYCLEWAEKESSRDLLATYMKSCSFPHAVTIDNSRDMLQEVEHIMITMLVKDLSLRKKHPDFFQLEDILDLLMDYMGETVTIKELVRKYNGKHKKISARTMAHYMQILKECFAIVDLEIVDLLHPGTKTVIRKYYVGDMSGYLYKNLAEKKSRACMENLVMLELIRRSYFVYGARCKKRTIDFFVKNQQGEEYFLQILTDEDEKEISRKLETLKLLGRDEKCRILSLNPAADEVDGIACISIEKWLMEKI